MSDLKPWNEDDVKPLSKAELKRQFGIDPDADLITHDELCAREIAFIKTLTEEEKREVREAMYKNLNDRRERKLK